MGRARQFFRNKGIVLGTVGDFESPSLHSSIEVIVANPESVSLLITLLSVVLLNQSVKQWNPRNC